MIKHHFMYKPFLNNKGYQKFQKNYTQTNRSLKIDTFNELVQNN